MEQQTFDKAQRFIEHVRLVLDQTIGDEEGMPVSAQVLVKSGVATHKQLDILVKGGWIQGVEFDVPSILRPGSTVKERAFCTERVEPKIFKSLGTVIEADPVDTSTMN
jgi:hypothetical protein